MDIAELLKDCIRNFNLDINKLRDLAFSICLADKKDGTNHIELDIDKFVEHDAELSWDNILRFLTITPQSKGCSSLPRVQKLRVISDVLTLSLSNEVPDLVLTCKSSKLVAKYLGVSVPSVDYASEDECLDNLYKINKCLENQKFNKDTEVQEILDLLNLYEAPLPDKLSKLDEHYIDSDELKRVFIPCTSDKFQKRDFLKDLNCHLLTLLINLEDYKWISLYNIYDTIAEHLKGEKVVYCITPEIKSKLSKCHRLYNSINLVGKCSYMVFDYRFTKILLISMYSRGLVEDLNKYI